MPDDFSGAKQEAVRRASEQAGRPHTYFVSYAFKMYDKTGVDHICIESPDGAEIGGAEDIEWLCEKIIEHMAAKGRRPSDVVILNYRRMDD